MLQIKAPVLLLEQEPGRHDGKAAEDYRRGMSLERPTVTEQ